jgi:hypothetical protein
MSQFFTSAEAGNLPPTVLETITGNDNVPEAAVNHNFNIVTANATPQFKGSAATETLDFGLSNLALGSKFSTSGVRNVSYGAGSLSSLTSGSSNNSYGTGTLIALTNGSTNSAFGDQCLAGLTGGSNNTVIGSSSGGNYAGNESSNILIKNKGVLGESNKIRIGDAGSGGGQQNAIFVAAITGVTAIGSPVAVKSDGQLSDLGFGAYGQSLTSNGSGVSPTWQGQFIVIPGVNIDFTALGATKLFTTGIRKFNVVGVSFLGINITGIAGSPVVNLGWTAPNYADLTGLNVFQIPANANDGVVYFDSPSYSPALPLPVVPASTDFYVSVTTADGTATNDIQQVNVFGYYL